MEKIIEFPDRRTIEQEAAAWLIKLDGDQEPTKEELKALGEWLGRSPVHREQLDSLNAFWSNNILTELVVPLGKHEVHTEPGLFQSLTLQLQAYGRMAAAAVLLLGVSIALGVWLINEQGVNDNGLYATAVGQQKITTLADGSVVQLNTNSQIEVEYGEQYRNIRLIQGEVHFSVAKNPQRPFRVYAGAGRVQAVGTAFTVYLKDQDINVLVTEGTVALAALSEARMGKDQLKSSAMHNTPETVSSDDRAIIDPYVKSPTNDLGLLKAGQRVTFNVADNQSSIKQKTLQKVEAIEAGELVRRQSWRKGLLIFSGESLAQVVDEISRYTTVAIEITDPAVRNIQIGGQIRVGDTEAMFEALETNFGLRVIRLSYNRVQLTTAKN